MNTREKSELVRWPRGGQYSQKIWEIKDIIIIVVDDRQEIG